MTFQRDADYETALKGEKPTDRLLRQAGFTIKDRPEGGEAVWQKGGQAYTESEAWYWMNQEAVRQKQEKRRG